LKLLGESKTTRLFLGTVLAVSICVLPALGAVECVRPSALIGTKDGETVFIAAAARDQVLSFDTTKRKVSRSIHVPESPSGLVLSRDETQLYVTCAAPESRVCIINPQTMTLCATILAGHTAMAPVPSPDGRTLYVCNRFNNEVSVIDRKAGQEVGRVHIAREPVSAALTKDGRFLLVANHLPRGRADCEYVAASVSVIGLNEEAVVRELPLPNGAAVVNSIGVSPNGRYAVVTHQIASFSRGASKVSLGWMNANALTLIDAIQLKVIGTVLLDEPARGAANPWGIAWSEDSATLVVTHAGTHEVSIIDFPALLAAMRVVVHERPGRAPQDNPNTVERASAFPVLTYVSAYEGMEPGLPFLTGARRRVKLPPTDLGPRAVTVVGHTAYVANYFSDTLSTVDFSVSPPCVESFPLWQDVKAEAEGHQERGARRAGERSPLASSPLDRLSLAQKGEFYFHDATLCFQGWQSCASCHPGDARADGLNWDLPNDGIGNPKNTKSLLLAFRTPPAMWLGVRETAGAAVRAGLRNILFAKPSEEVAVAIEAYLKSLKPVPSPFLENGRPSKAAKRGKAIFVRAGCASCHPPGLSTDLHQYDVGTARAFDKQTDKFDTPSLIELWRTAPYLHDGSAATVLDVLTTRNPHDQHGKTSNLSSKELDDLCAYLLSS
jgi:YVTN family beta-propeller protein